MAARLITLEASDSEIKSLWELVEKYEDNDVPANLDEYSDANIEFHQRILKLSKCKILEDTAAGLFMHVRAIRARTIGEDNRAVRSVVDHSHIIEAFEARDTELAEQLVREHTLNLRAHVELYLDLGDINEASETQGVA
jgi:DNA-binding GntR family transcriptional regulator